MSKKPYSERITDAKVMADGIKEMKDNLPLGVQESDSEKLEQLRQEVEALNSKQESIKAELKSTTEQFNEKINQMDKLYSNIKKRVKLDIEQSLWKKFGIDDKR